MSTQPPFGRRRLQCDPVVRQVADYACGQARQRSEQARARCLRRAGVVSVVALAALFLIPTVGAGLRDVTETQARYDAMSPEDLARLEPAAGEPLGVLAKIRAALGN